MQLLEAIRIIEACAPEGVTLQYSGEDFKLSPKGQVEVTLYPTMEPITFQWWVSERKVLWFGLMDADGGPIAIISPNLQDRAAEYRSYQNN